MKTIKDKYIVVGSDAAGYPLKEAVKLHLQDLGWHVEDVGCSEENGMNEMFHRVGFKVGAKISESALMSRPVSLRACPRENAQLPQTTSTFFPWVLSMCPQQWPLRSSMSSSALPLAEITARRSLRCTDSHGRRSMSSIMRHSRQTASSLSTNMMWRDRDLQETTGAKAMYPTSRSSDNDADDPPSGIVKTVRFQRTVFMCEKRSCTL